MDCEGVIKEWCEQFVFVLIVVVFLWCWESASCEREFLSWLIRMRGGSLPSIEKLYFYPKGKDVNWKSTDSLQHCEQFFDCHSLLGVTSLIWFSRQFWSTQQRTWLQTNHFMDSGKKCYGNILVRPSMSKNQSRAISVFFLENSNVNTDSEYCRRSATFHRTTTCDVTLALWNQNWQDNPGPDSGVEQQLNATGSLSLTKQPTRSHCNINPVQFYFGAASGPA